MMNSTQKVFKNVVKLCRPQQWIKNMFVFLPLFFGRKATSFEHLRLTFLAFLAFSFIASAIYCFNDLYDKEADKRHPKKAARPIASGAINEREAIVLIIALLATAAVVFYFSALPSEVIYISSFYLFLNIGYSIKLKHVAIIDVMIIATGFVLRLFVGGAAGSVYLSHWIIIMTFLLALFLALAKRRDDCLIFEQTGIKARTNIARYNLQFINTALSIVIAVMLVAYILYTLSEDVINRIGNRNLYLTSIFVVLGSLRYLQLTMVDEDSGSPTEIILTDRFIQISLIGWILVFAYFLYC